MTPESPPQPPRQRLFLNSRQTTKSLALFGSALLLMGTGLTWQIVQKRGNLAIGQQQQPPGVPVKLTTLAPETVTISSDFVGSLEAEQVVEIRPEITGRVRRLLVEDGQAVSQGQRLAELQPDQERANLDSVLATVTAAQANQASASANVTSAQASRNNTRFQLNALKDDRIALKAEVDLAKEDYRRIEFLVKEGVFTEQQLDQARRDRDVAIANLASIDEQIAAAEESLNEAQAGLLQAEAGLTQAQANLNQTQANASAATAELADTFIVAPFAGVIGDIPARIGSVVSDADTLMTLTQNSLLSLRISVPTEQAPELRRGQFVELVTEQGNILNTGQISFINPSIEPSRQTVLAKATFRNGGNLLRNGQFVRARLIWRTEPGLLIPPVAITRLAGEPFVFVAEPPGAEDEVPPEVEFVARQRPVKLGKLQNNRYQVLSGLKPGEQIVTAGVPNLTNGMALIVLPADAPDSDFVGPPPGE
ncbi:MAG: efflux RND transporter periplasmic adaptor subunit [Cyanobacteria bacterium P01_G01_bin.54]